MKSIFYRALLFLQIFGLAGCKINLNNQGDPLSSSFFQAGLMNEFLTPHCRIWANNFGTGRYLTMLNDLAALPNGDIIATGITNEPLTSGNDLLKETKTPFTGVAGTDMNIFIVKISSRTGAAAWVDYLGKPQNSDSAKSTVKISASGEIFIGGIAVQNSLPDSISPMAGNPYSFLLAKYSQDGTRQWLTYLDSTDLTWPYAFEVDTKNYIHLFLGLNGTNNHSPLSEFPSPTNTHSGETNYSDIIYALLSTIGTPISQQYIQGLGSEEAVSAIRNGDSVFLGGTAQNLLSTPNVTTHPSPGNKKNFLAKVRVNSNLRQEPEWATYSGSASSIETRLRKILNVKGNILSLGHASDSFGTPAETSQTSGLRNLAYESFDTQGNSLWHSYFGHATTGVIEGSVATLMYPTNSESLYSTTIGLPNGEKFLVSSSIEVNQPSGAYPLTTLRINANTGKFERILYELNKPYPVLYYKNQMIQTCIGAIAIAYQEIPSFGNDGRGYFTIKTIKASDLP
ncbi:hypothetical protein [Leptospira ilyithenensis]|uniref:Lipoprotein n=1 Tax=Leptospira ilyithenensis TaxID=2484901 RepID=A0A4R9LPA5_9LEPT|nr:hypothetical protein [Leptospira ilyithenensis]TGN08702.1 hypothetical protein EHS11_13140 [Leptospira ilyithenensis]